MGGLLGRISVTPKYGNPAPDPRFPNGVTACTPNEQKCRICVTINPYMGFKSLESS